LKQLQIEWDDEIGPVLSLTIKNRKLGLCFCHRKKDRTIWFFGLEKFFCSRCLGIVLGGIVGFVCVLYHYWPGLFWSVLLLLPLMGDSITQAMRWRESNNILRFVTGFMFGIGLQFFLAIVLQGAVISR